MDISNSLKNLKNVTIVINESIFSKIASLFRPKPTPTKEHTAIPIVSKSRNIKYINREIDTVIDSHIQNQSHKMIIVNAEGGFGKSTLVNNIFDRYKETPIILINTQSSYEIEVTKLLLDNEYTSIQNCNTLQDIRTRYINGEEIKEIEIIEALFEDFAHYGIFVVDTFEKSKELALTSIVTFSNNRIELNKDKRYTKLKYYIQDLFDGLSQSSTFIIAGRNEARDIDFEIEDEQIEELSISGFSDDNIKEYFRLSNIKLPENSTISTLNTLTSSNPLLITLFPKIIKEYSGDWNELDIEEMKERVQNDKKYGLLFYLTDRILSHIDKDIKLYKLILPRVLSKEIEVLLYKKDKLLDTLIDSGLA